MENRAKTALRLVSYRPLARFASVLLHFLEHSDAEQAKKIRNNAFRKSAAPVPHHKEQKDWRTVAEREAKKAGTTLRSPHVNDEGIPGNPTVLLRE